MSYESDLREELARLEVPLDGLQPKDFVSSLVKSQLERRRQDVVAALDAQLRHELESKTGS